MLGIINRLCFLAATIFLIMPIELSAGGCDDNPDINCEFGEFFTKVQFKAPAMQQTEAFEQLGGRLIDGNAFLPSGDGYALGCMLITPEMPIFGSTEITMNVEYSASFSGPIEPSETLADIYLIQAVLEVAMEGEDSVRFYETLQFPPETSYIPFANDPELGTLYHILTPGFISRTYDGFGTFGGNGTVRIKICNLHPYISLRIKSASISSWNL